MADFLNVTGFQVNLDREAVLQFEKARGIQHGRWVVLGERLLGGAKEPDRSFSDLFEILGQALKIINQIRLGRHILANLIDDEEDVLLTRTCGEPDRSFPHPALVRSC